jgi:iron complex outermembrane recepter protein
MRKALGGAALAVVSTCALAQQVESVVVSATRTPRPELEVPASVDRIGGDEVREDRAQVNLSESMGAVPGISVMNRQNYAQDLQVQSRGFGARSTFGVRGVRLIADGIPATMPDGQGQAATFALGSAESIEVLRGPFSALYGNAAGGVILVQTMDGPEAPTAEADLYFGSYGTGRTGLKFGGQYGGLNGIADLSHFETDGYREHSTAQRDHLNAKLKYQTSPGGALTLVANSLRQPDTQDPLGLTRAQFEQDPRQASPVAAQFNTKKTIGQGQLGGTLTQRVGDGRVEAMLYGGQRQVEQFLAIPLVTQLAPTHSGGIVDLDRTYGGGALRGFARWGAVGLSLGAEYDVMYERRKGFINNNGVVGALKRDEDNTVSSTAFYAQAEWKFAERWLALLGARNTRVAFDSQDYYVAAGNGNDSGSRTYGATTPVAGILYRLSGSTSVYGSFGRGFETPTFVELAYSTGGSGLNFGLDASTSRHFELGVKHVAPGTARLNAAVFDIVTSDEIVVDSNSGGRAIYRNAGHTDRKGFEIGAETLSGGPFELRAAYTYLDATFREGFNTVIGTFPNNTPVAVPAGAGLPGVAQNQLFADLRYRRSYFHATLEVLHRTSVPVNDPNTDSAPGFTVWNLAAGFFQQDSQWRFVEFARIDNLGNKDYIGSVIVNETGFRYFEPAPRRSISVGLRAAYKF